MTTWSQLGIHSDRPVLVLSVNGFYAPLKEQILLAAREGFIQVRPFVFTHAFLVDSTRTLNRYFSIHCGSLTI